MSDTAALISAALIMASLYITFHLGIECERERARQARRKKFEQDNHDSANHDDFD